MDEHISKGNYSTEVNKYNTVKEKVAEEKEHKISVPNRKKCEVEEVEPLTIRQYILCNTGKTF